MKLIVFVVVGIVAGWLAGRIMKGGGFGAVGNLVVGVMGALVGGFLFSLLGIQVGGLFGPLVTATIGAVLLLFLVKVLRRV